MALVKSTVSNSWNIVDLMVIVLQAQVICHIFDSMDCYNSIFSNILNTKLYKECETELKVSADIICFNFFVGASDFELVDCCCPDGMAATLIEVSTSVDTCAVETAVSLHGASIFHGIDVSSLSFSISNLQDWHNPSLAHIEKLICNGQLVKYDFTVE